MHITFLTPHTKSGSGGIKVIFRLAMGLKDAGMDVAIVANKAGGDFDFLLDKKLNLSVTEVPVINYNTLPKTDCLIHFGDGQIYTALPTNVKNILYLQGFGTQNKVQETLNLMFPYDCVIATSSWLANLAAKFHDNVFIVPPGVDSNFKTCAVPKFGNPVVGTLYHDSPEKGVSLFNAVMARVYAEMGGKVKAAYLAANYPMKTKEDLDALPFIWSMAVNPTKRLLASFYSSCDVWMAPSSNEGFGLCGLEAMSCGVPLVTHPNLGLDDYLVSGTNCLMSTDKKTLAGMVVQVLTDSKLRNVLSDNGRKLAARFTWEKAIANFKSVLDKVL
jgi:glycosyltransferase involved in cell wall biosynthesis